jgi:hypothetical protein
MTPLQLDLAAIGRRHAAPGSPAVALPTRPDVEIVRVGEVVVKAHAPGMDPATLRPRMAAAALLGGIMLAPLTTSVESSGDRLVTVWPAGEPVDPADPDGAPWEESARLLAALHAVPLARLPALPAAGGPARVLHRVAALADGAAEDLIRAAARALPEPEPGDGPAHGDWHMGQLVRHDRWLLIDVDDLGHGDQAWDLARPAAWFATGLLDPAVWSRFLTAYQEAGGRALAEVRDPWERLDGPARSLTVQLAATAVAKARTAGRPIDEAEEVMLDACRRIAGIRHRPPQPLTQ